MINKNKTLKELNVNKPIANDNMKIKLMSE